MPHFILRILFVALLLSFVCERGYSQIIAELPPGLAIPETDEGQPGTGPIRRSDWFHNVWNERRGSFVANEKRDQGALVFFGDSITQGWGNRLEKAFPGVKVANRGISGDTTRGMLIRLQKDVINLNPSGVVMLMGTNDIDDDATPEQIAGNVKLIVNALKQYNSAMPIVLCLIMPSSPEKGRPIERIQAVNNLYKKLVQGDPQITVLDIWTLFANEQGDAKAEEFPDLLHPNDLGYAKWAAALRPILATQGFLEKEPDEFTPEEGFTVLFNGQDLTGWGYRPTSEDDIAARKRWHDADPNAANWPILTEATSFDGQSASTDGRFLAKNGRLIVTTPTEGRKIQQLWTECEFSDDFTLKLEFRATPNADSGIYIRGKQLQCRDYALAGPYKKLKNYKSQDWNEIVVEVTGNTARCTCNGEVLETVLQVPDNGPIGLEGDRGQVEYRRIRVKESK